MMKQTKAFTLIEKLVVVVLLLAGGASADTINVLSNLVTLRSSTGLGAAQAWGQWQQTHKLIAGDTEPDDRFGRSVAISSGIAIVGVYRDDDACPSDPDCNSGSAYLFDVTTGEQLHKLTANDAAAGDHFGVSVGISTNIAIVGTWLNDDACPKDPGCNSGSAYLFDVATGQQLHKLTASDAAANDRFGLSVAISGEVAIVGAYLEDACPDNPGCNSGSAYLFDVATGEQLHKLTAADAAAEDHFGSSVSISGVVVIVGAQRNDDAGLNSGSAYLYDVDTGQQLHKLAAEDAAARDRFGVRVAINGGSAIVGAHGDDDACPDKPNCESGSAYVFDVGTGQQVVKLLPDDGAAFDQFGFSVALSGATAIVGARLNDDACPDDPICDSGSVYFFDAATGRQLQKLTANGAAAHDWFGVSVAISDGITIVGSEHDDDACPEDPWCFSGSAYVFAQSDPCADDDGDGRVTICHLPPGNPGNARTITVRANAVPAHLAHGDHCGPCRE